MLISHDQKFWLTSEHVIRYTCCILENPKMPKITALWMTIDQTGYLHTVEPQGHNFLSLKMFRIYIIWMDLWVLTKGIYIFTKLHF